MEASGTILDRIVEEKHKEVSKRIEKLGIDSLKRRIESQGPCRGFVDAIASRVSRGQAAVIAEIKKASPSRGVIRADFHPESIARSYEDAGAACLSVLTDVSFFQGADEYLQRARAEVSLPVLRKDFIISPYQIFEARAIGADCVLLIASILDIEDMNSFADLAMSLGLDVLIEVHDQVELNLALSVSPKLVGINNRDLKTFDVDLETTLSLCALIPDDVIVVTESGITRTSHVEKMLSSGVYGFLVGEAFMKEPDPGRALELLFT